MGVPANHPVGAGAPGAQLGRSRPEFLPRRRRPSGAAPPLPHHVRATGLGWLAVTTALVTLTVLVFAGGLRGPAVAVTVVDDAVVRWLGSLGLEPALRVPAALGSWTSISVLLYGLLLALLIFKRFRHLFVVVISWTLQGLVIQYVMGPLLARPRPFGVEFRTGWDGWAMPSERMAALVIALVGILYGLVPEGSWRQIGKWAATALVTLIATSRVALGVEAPTDVLVGIAIGVTIPLLGFRLFTPSEVVPVTYRRGRTAHLDVGGARGEAIRRALRDQLGLVVDEVEPFGLEGSAGSTPLRLKVADDRYLFGKLYARNHLRSDRWYKLGRELLYGRLEDEKPFNTVRRLVQQEDYALRLLRDAGLPSPQPYGVVELTPEREYLLVTEFFSNAAELGKSDIDDGVIDEGLEIIRRLWDAGLAHRDIKPANLLVSDGHLKVIDVFFTEVCPSPWRQAVDLANMMLCLALRSDPERVYARAVRQFSVAEISEGFAAARGLALPSQLRRIMRDEGRDLHAEFVRLLPTRPRPIGIQHWSARRISLLLIMLPVAALLVAFVNLVLVNSDTTTTFLNTDNLSCDRPEPLWLSAQAVPTASLVPCVRTVPPTMSVSGANVSDGWSRFELAGIKGDDTMVVRLTPTCDTAGAVPGASDQPGARRYVRTEADRVTWHDVFPGGCVSTELRPATGPDSTFHRDASLALGFTSRQALQQTLEDRSNGRLHLDPVAGG